MSTMTVIIVLAGALAGVMIFQAIVFFLFMREFKNLLKDMLSAHGQGFYGIRPRGSDFASSARNRANKARGRRHTNLNKI